MAPVLWSSLPGELVQRVADTFLASNDIDFYMDLRAVCHNWRESTDDPRKATDDPRFRPSRWILVDSLPFQEDRARRPCRFLHIDTGRFVWKNLPIPRICECITSTEDGRVVFKKTGNLRTKPTFWVVNPFNLSRSVLIPRRCDLNDIDRGVVGFGRYDNMMIMRKWMMAWCDTDACSCRGNRRWKILHNDGLDSSVAFKGLAYLVDEKGTVLALEDRPLAEPVVIVPGCFEVDKSLTTRLVRNVDELLLVRASMFTGFVEVFRVDLERKAFEKIQCTGNRAIFLGYGRSVSVDAEHFPDIEGDCIYMQGWWLHRDATQINRGIRIKHLVDGREETVTMGYRRSDAEYEDDLRFSDYIERLHRRPISLMDYMLLKCAMPLHLIAPL